MSELRYIRYQENGEWKYASVKTVGDLTTLKTKSKSDIVSAINSMFETGGIIQDILDELEGVEGDNEEILEQIDGIHEIININKETVEDMERMSNELKEKQQAMEEMQSAMEERQQEILNGLENKINKEEYDVEYQGVLEELRKKVSSFDFENLTGEFSRIEKHVTNLDDEVSTKLSKIDFNDAVGVNKWAFDSYEIEGINFSDTNPSFEFIKGISPVYSEEMEDQVDLSFLREANRINYLFTNVNLETSKTVGFDVKFKDGIAIYMNGALIYRNNSPVEITADVSLSLRKGWNTVEILHGFNNTNPKLQMTPLLSSQVDKMTTVIGVGKKDETRLINIETEIKHTHESINLKADKTVVSQIGNDVASNTAELEVHAEAIKQTVKSREFNEYTKVLTDAVAEIEVNSEAIKQTVNKKEYDALNEIVTEQGSKIEQTFEDIELKVDKKELDDLEETVKSNETRIGLNETQISLRAEKSELDKTNKALNNAVAEINVHSEKIELAVTKEEFRNLDIGGRNLITLDSVSMQGATVDGHKYTLIGTTTNRAGISIPPTLFEDDTEYVITFKTKKISGEVFAIAGHSQHVDSSTVRIFRDGNEIIAPSNGWHNGDQNYPNDTNVHQYEVRFKTDSDIESNSNPTWHIQPNRLDYGKDYVLEIWDWQLEKGNKATAWREAPEEIEDRMSRSEARIELTEEAILLKADQTEVEKKIDTTVYNNKISQIETSINGINTKVGKTETAVDDLTGEMTSAKKSIAELDIKAEGIITSVTKLTESVGNLVKNPQVTGNHEGWNGGSVTSTTQDFQGESVRVLRNTSTTNSTTYSEWFDVDPSKAYEVTAWVKKSATRGRFYFGVHGNNDGGTTNNSGFDYVSDATGSVTDTNGTNGYFQSGANNGISGWTKMTGYLMPSGTISKSMTGIGTNVQRSFIMNPKTNRVRLRWLNYENGGTTTYLYVAMPRVSEVSSDTLTYASSTISQLSNEISSKVSTVDYNGETVASLITQNPNAINMIANNINLTGKVSFNELAIDTALTLSSAYTNSELARGWKYGNTTEIDGGNIRTRTIDAESLNVTNLSAITSDLGDVTAGKIRSRTTIDVTTDLRVGDNIYVGDGTGSSTKRVVLGTYQSANDYSGIQYTDGDHTLTYFAYRHKFIGGIDVVGGINGTKITTSNLEVSGAEIVSEEGIRLTGRAISRGLHLGSYNRSHTIVSHNTNESLYIYPHRFTGENILTVRSHVNKSSYRNEFWIDHRGYLYTPPTFDNTTTNSANLRVGTSAGLVTRMTSSKKFKLAIESFDKGYEKILLVNPKTWYDKNNTERYADYIRRKNNGEDVSLDDVELLRRTAGLIAEEVKEAGLDIFVEYDENGEIAGVQYDRIWTLLIPIIRDLKYELNLFSMENQFLKQELIKIKEELYK